MSAPVHSNAIDVSNITFQVGKPVAKRSPPISIRYAGTQLQIRLPRLACPFGLRENSNDAGVKSYKLAAVLKGCDPYCKEKYVGDDDIGKLGNFLMELDEHIKKAAIANSTQWFGKKRSDTSIIESYASNIYPSTELRDGERVPNGKYPPTFRIKVPVYDGRVSAEFVDASRNHVYVTPESLVSILPKGIESNMILTPSIYVINGTSFGVTWRLKAAQIFPVPQVTAAMMFDDESNAPPSKGVVADADEDEYGGGALAEESAPKEEVLDEVKPMAGAGAGSAPAAPAATVRKRRAAPSSSAL